VEEDEGLPWLPFLDWGDVKKPWILGRCAMIGILGYITRKSPGYTTKKYD
jgi:hypothetical protein